MADDDIWQHRDEALRDEDLIGFDVVGTDGPLGEVAATGYSAGREYVMVTLSHGEPGREVAVPAGLVASADVDAEVVRLSVGADAVLGCPTRDPARGDDADGFEVLAAYWGEHATPDAD